MRILILLLAFAVPSHVVHAHKSWYLPPTNHGHFQFIASKTKVSVVSVHAIQPLLCQAAAPALPEFDEHALGPLEDVPLHPSVNLAFPLQDRAPPRQLA